MRGTSNARRAQANDRPGDAGAIEACDEADAETPGYPSRGEGGCVACSPAATRNAVVRSRRRLRWRDALCNVAISTSATAAAKWPIDDAALRPVDAGIGGCLEPLGVDRTNSSVHCQPGKPTPLKPWRATKTSTPSMSPGIVRSSHRGLSLATVSHKAHAVPMNKPATAQKNTTTSTPMLKLVSRPSDRSNNSQQMQSRGGIVDARATPSKVL